MTGKLIVLEGIDKAGKETQANKLLEYLNSKGIPSVKFEEPSQNVFGHLIRDFLDRKIDIKSGKALSLLYTADRYEHLKSEVIPALESGKTVILDRYFYSTIVYESVLFDQDTVWLREINKFAVKPDLVIFVDIEPELSVDRAMKMGEQDRFERLDFQQKVREAYLTLAREDGFKVVDGSKSENEVHEEIKRIIDLVI